MAAKIDAAAVFETARPALTGLAYRILGSHAEAEDVVQDSFLAWMSADRTAIEFPQRWLMTVCTRKAIDALRSARLSRTSYVGPWLPEPVRTDMLDSPQEAAALSESATTAFLLVLERLSPKERAAFLLRDVFDMDYAEVADGLDVSEPACRKLVSRARSNLRQPQKARPVPKDRQETLVAAFERAVRTGETELLAAQLSADVRLTADGGGKVPSINRPLEGADAVLGFVGRALSRYWQGQDMRAVELNAGLALIVAQDGPPHAAVTFEYDADEKLSGVFIVRNPDKLARLDAAAPVGSGVSLA